MKSGPWREDPPPSGSGRSTLPNSARTTGRSPIMRWSTWPARGHRPRVFSPRFARLVSSRLVSSRLAALCGQLAPRPMRARRPRPRLRPSFGDGLTGGVDLRQDRSGVGEEASAGREELHPPRRSAKERRPELILEVADLTAQRRLGDVQAAGGPADVLLFGDGDEVGDLRQAHGAQRRARLLGPTRGRSKRYRGWSRQERRRCVG